MTDDGRRVHILRESGFIGRGKMGTFCGWSTSLQYAKRADEIEAGERVCEECAIRNDEELLRDKRYEYERDRWMREYGLADDTSAGLIGAEECARLIRLYIAERERETTAAGFEIPGQREETNARIAAVNRALGR